MRKAHFLSIYCTKPIMETIDSCDKSKELRPQIDSRHGYVSLRGCIVCSKCIPVHYAPSSDRR